MKGRRGGAPVMIASTRPDTTSVTYAKANPGKLNYTSAGVGSSAHVSMAYFNIAVSAGGRRAPIGANMTC
jgi:tripartite-type tricarboxylate transporter receptor subunit TctC